jgi:hypothetical protein
MEWHVHLSPLIPMPSSITQELMTYAVQPLNPKCPVI